MLAKLTAKIKTAPKTPGVYIFYRNQNPLYIGKASNLKNRLKDYLRIIDFKTNALHKEANGLELIKLNSNIEALIVESQLIKKLKPRYNIFWRDDKNYFYVVVTNEKFPRLIIAHQLSSGGKLKIKDYIGPFTEGQPLKIVLRLLRRTLPYCTHKPHWRICLDSQINNCPGYCCNKNARPTKKEGAAYRNNIDRIKKILAGKDKKSVRALKDPYELLALDKIWQHEPYLNNDIGLEAEHLENKKEENIFPAPSFLNLQRAECYDNSHLSGKEAVGAMTTWKKENGAWTADKDKWRKFKITGDYTEDDPRMMAEIISRRLNHPEWAYPDLIIIDGGLNQLKAAGKALGSKKIELIAFAKPDQKIYGLKIKPILLVDLPPDFQKLIATAIKITHNFAVRFHRKTRERRFLMH